MNRKILIAAVLLFVLTIAGIILGLIAAPGAMVPALLCTFPLFLLIFGVWLGRVSNEYEIVNKQRPPAPASGNRLLRQNKTQQELLS